MLHNVNFFIFLYKIINEILQFNEHMNNNFRIILNSQIQLIVKKNFNKRRYNFFINNEMIVIIFNEYDIFCARNIVLTKCCNKIKQIFLRRIN